MTSPIKLYGHIGPNPLKVMIVLNLLNIPYEVEEVPFSDVKKPEYTAVNPNGRIPSIHDPNTGLTLWESGAIIEYLVDKYDTDNKLSFANGSPEFYQAKQWLHFQMSGQGPYYGQVFWFSRYHSEKVPSAVERYTKEINRVTGVLEGHLKSQKEKTGSAWLVGDSLSYVDLAFIPWQLGVARMLEKADYDQDAYPHVKEWIESMTAKEEVSQAIAAVYK
ncbi:hypothetical protein ASPWEDRAFT_643090 [Aspergillus wentii DTO 134E9]|uniref:Glutathione S-transferase n=1 Tax=Aspergillus wentii DTO 134E9 TaxID=1073089 RepID=A0A1L9RAI3_ASPWE|nr:uncharacterized protein ASPWEDRAFT_643090 [Aspergillus wentii DTO 134E9]KAI9934516.1 hypothetical protein MW887_000130 [Aspergillus wentii]OJJ31932.1 hypothetical protein ASPWEDRAFT_643090 [Aspergillus wentii DTO 134E9]